MTLTVFLNLGLVEQFNLHVTCGLVTAFFLLLFFFLLYILFYLVL